jgi:hypothetical protein
VVNRCERFGGVRCLHVHGRAGNSATFVCCVNYVSTFFFKGCNSVVLFIAQKKSVSV